MSFDITKIELKLAKEIETVLAYLGLELDKYKGLITLETDNDLIIFVRESRIGSDFYFSVTNCYFNKTPGAVFSIKMFPCPSGQLEEYKVNCKGKNIKYNWGPWINCIQEYKRISLIQEEFTYKWILRLKCTSISPQSVPY